MDKVGYLMFSGKTHRVTYNPNTFMNLDGSKVVYTDLGFFDVRFVFDTEEELKFAWSTRTMLE